MCLGLLAVATKSNVDVKELKMASNMAGALKNYAGALASAISDEGNEITDEGSLVMALNLRAKLLSMTRVETTGNKEGDDDKGELTITCVRKPADLALKRLEVLCDAAGLKLLKSLTGQPLLALKTRFAANCTLTSKMDAALRTLEMGPFLVGLGLIEVSPTCEWDALLKFMPDYLKAASADLCMLQETNYPAVAGCKFFMDSVGKAVTHQVGQAQLATTSLKDLVSRCRFPVPIDCFQ
jgi:hypothetical protein